MIIIIFLFFFSYIGLLIHGSVPVHYYVTVAPLITIIAAFAISKIKINLFWIFILIIAINFGFYFSEKWFYKKGNYERQVQVVKDIVKDANGRKYNLSRVGEFDYYSDNYSQNYQYLLWLYGNEPSKTIEVLKYTIYEEGNNISFK